jgi:mRNA-degrading endonuclease RelE of RelBE toxin-antitoxin system
MPFFEKYRINYKIDDKTGTVEIVPNLVEI